jgi:hypothetical protein
MYFDLTALDLLFPHRGAVAACPPAEDGAGLFIGADAELGCLALTAPGRGEGETVDGLPTAGCNNPTSRSGITVLPGTSHERSISSRSFALSLFDIFAPFLPFCRRRSNASTSLSALVSAKSSSTMSSRSSSGARGYGHRDDSSWKGTSTRGAGEVPARGAGAAGTAGAVSPVVGAGSEEGTGGADVAAVGRTEGAE